jgi:hypothetical protein
MKATTADTIVRVSTAKSLYGFSATARSVRLDFLPSRGTKTFFWLERNQALEKSAAKKVSQKNNTCKKKIEFF